MVRAVSLEARFLPIPPALIPYPSLPPSLRTGVLDVDDCAGRLIGGQVDDDPVCRVEFQERRRHRFPSCVIEREGREGKGVRRCAVRCALCVVRGGEGGRAVAATEWLGFHHACIVRGPRGLLVLAPFPWQAPTTEARRHPWQLSQRVCACMLCVGGCCCGRCTVACL